MSSEALAQTQKHLPSDDWSYEILIIGKLFRRAAFSKTLVSLSLFSDAVNI